MAAALKDQIFPLQFYHTLAGSIQELYPSLNHEAFVAKATKHVDSLELKDRTFLAVDLIHEFVKLPYSELLSLFVALAPKIETGYAGIILPSYIEKYGLENYHESIKALHFLTRFSTAEFAIRPFLATRFEETMETLLQWTKEENEHVRRLASEGTRPLLPWASRVPQLTEFPKAALPILETLNKDESLYVRKSVGNHLNDLTKKNADMVCDLLTSWDASHKHTAWIINRGLRTLIKEGHPRAFELLGYDNSPEVKIISFTSDKQNYALGEKGKITVVLTSNKPQLINVDLELWYKKKNGSSKKVFKIKAGEMQAGEQWILSKTISFTEMTTRKHYAGEHKAVLLINGGKSKELSFNLSCP